MASGGPGYGRGGRGAALLAALNAPVRKPGAQTPSKEESSATPPTQQPPRPTGRGFLLQQRLQQAQQPAATQPAAPTVVQPAPIPGAPSIPPAVAAKISPPPPPIGTLPGRGLGRAQHLQSLLAKPGAGRGALISAVAKASPGRGSLEEKAKTPSPPGAAAAAAPSHHSSPEMEKAHQAAEERRLTKLEYMLKRIELEEPTVTKIGNYGAKVPLMANYIPVKCLSEGQFQYAVSYTPEVHSRGMRYKLLYSYDKLGPARSFDGSILFLPHRLPEVTEFEAIRPTDNEPIKIKIRLVKILRPENCLQLYNVLFRNIFKILKYVEVQRHDYDPHQPAKIPQHRLEVWPGYVTSLSRYAGGLMLMCDVSHKVLRTETAYDIMTDIHQKHGGERFHDMVAKELIGAVVMTRYNNKTYRIDDVDFTQNPASTFPTRDGGEQSFVEYYKRQYNRDIKDMNQPLLIHRPSKRDLQSRRKGMIELVLLVPELCYLTGLSDNMRADFRVMKDLATHTRVPPSQRHMAMRKFCENVNSSPEARNELAKWGLELDMDCVQVAGRKMPEEQVIFGGGKSVSSGPKADWTRAATANGSMLQAVPLENWICICTERNGNITVDAVRTMVQVATQMGMPMKDPQIFRLRNDRTEEYLRCIHENLSEQVQMVMMIMPTSRDDRYNAVKKKCCVESPVPSQVINSKTISRKDKLRSVCQKIVLQLNCKLGGSLWGVKVPPIVNSKEHGGLMVVGIDVYHDKSHGQSVAAIVCSIDKRISRFYSETIFQASRQEITDKFKVPFMAAIRKYYQVNHMLPQNIMVFRDGVGDGQMRVVAEHEVEQLMSSFTHFGQEYQPNFCEVVVQKRVNTRMFLRQGGGRNAGLANPAPGTVMDHTITRRDWYDFFLVSQFVTQGTVTPSHYVVVKDHSEWTADVVQRVTYQMTHLYYNWPGTIRVPAPCQYAHKLAQLAGQNLHKKPADALNDRLFYL